MKRYMLFLAVIALITVSMFVVDSPAQGAGTMQTPTRTPFVGEPPSAYRPVRLPLVNSNAIPHMVEAGSDGYRDMEVNLHIYGFDATYLVVLPPDEYSDFWRVCWHGFYPDGSIAAHCDEYIGEPEVSIWD